MGRKLKAILLDLEGTLYFKGEMIPGADQALEDLREQDAALRFLTNTDSKSTRTISAELAQMGLAVETNEIFTPFSALREFLRSNPGKRCHFLLSRELSSETGAYTASGEKVDYVVVGDFRESVSYEALNTAFQHIMAGAEIIALQKGRYFIRANGYNLDTGAFVQLLEYASGKAARVLGKPSPDFFSLALDQVGCRPEEAAVVGDDLSTDIAGAKEIGASAVLVQTGKFSADSLAKSPVRPDMVAPSIADVPSLLKELEA